jgi:hypothetical protein
VGVRLQPPPSRLGRVGPPAQRSGWWGQWLGGYADIDSGVAVAVMRNRFTAGDLTTAALTDQIAARVLT